VGDPMHVPWCQFQRLGAADEWNSGPQQGLLTVATKASVRDQVANRYVASEGSLVPPQALARMSAPMLQASDLPACVATLSQLIAMC
jgi:hypothetical protein